MEGEILAGLFVARTDEHGKRLANQALTDGIEIREDERATIRLYTVDGGLVGVSS